MERTLDAKERWRNRTVGFRVSEEEAKMIDRMVALSGLTKQEYIQRQKEGIEAAKLWGVHFGRPKRQVPDNFEQICWRWKNGEIIGKETAQLCNMPLTTFYGRAKQLQER